MSMPPKIKRQEDSLLPAKSTPKHKILICLVTLAVLLLMCGISLAIAAESGRGDDIHFRMSSSLLMSDGWVYAAEDGSVRSVVFPFQSDGNDAWLYNTLPDNLNM